MRKHVSIFLAAVLASSVLSYAPASAMPAAPALTSIDGPAVQLVDRYIGGGRHWRRGRGGHWGGHHHGHGGYGLGFGAFGFGTGLLLGSQLGYYGGYGGYGGYDGYYYGQPYYGGGYYGGYVDSDVACARRYRSYDPYSNTFLGYDGYRHLCRL
jgi:hypothetical protein